MAEHDLSALDGLLDELDIEERGNEDPRAAKLKALFEKAKAEYTAKIDSPTWFIASSSNVSGSTTPFDPANYRIPSPTELLAARKKDRTGSINQEWTVNYLYTQGHFELCLSYVTSFAVSMGVDFDFDAADSTLYELDSTQLALRRSKQERKVSKNWGVIKDIFDCGIRSLLTLLRTSSFASSSSMTISTWIPNPSSGYKLSEVTLQTLAKGFLVFSMREVRVGAGDTRSGYSGMVIPASDPTTTPRVDLDKVAIQNWTVTHGLALTAGDLALEFGLYRTAIEAHMLFLAARGQMWRVLLALAHELSSYAASLESQSRANAASLQALQVVAKAAVVSAIQASPRTRRLEVAKSVIVEHSVIPAHWIHATLQDGYKEETGFEDEDDLLFNGLLQPAGGERAEEGGWTVVPEEIGVALTKVVFAKKSGLFAIFEKFATYMREYTARLEATADAEAQEWAGDLDANDDDDTQAGPRSVRTL